MPFVPLSECLIFGTEKTTLMPDLSYLEDLIVQVRRDILRQVHKVNSGHPGGSLGCTEFFVALYQVIMDRKDSFDMDGKGEDLFFLSNGHISPVFYSVLARSGYFPIEELNTFRLIDMTEDELDSAGTAGTARSSARRAGDCGNSGP